MKLDDLKGKKVIDYRIIDTRDEVNVEIILENNMYLKINLTNLPVDAITIGKLK